MLTCVLQQVKPPPVKATCTMRDFRNLDSISFKHDLTDKLASIPFTSDVDSFLNHFNAVAEGVLDLHAPQSTRTRTIRPQPKWYSDEIRAEKRELRRLERKWRKNRLTIHKDIYMSQHAKVINLIEKAKEGYYKDVLYKAGVRDTFKVLGTLLNKNSRVLPTYDSSTDLCNRFANFFSEKIDGIRANIESKSVDLPSSTVTRNYTSVTKELLAFRKLSEDDVCKIIKSSANKSCSLDFLPTWMVKDYIDIVVGPITSIVNQSLTSGVFPHILKQAVVTPIIKKTNLDRNELSNYRPVSNINFIGKVIEKAAIMQVDEHVDDNNLHEVYQSAYKICHSTETALLRVKDDIDLALDNNHAVFLIMLDLSAAFDTIDHNILFQRFEYDFGIKGTALDWFKSYMSGRKFHVSLYGAKSDDHTLHYGVPQGSIIGPKAFTMYAQSVTTIILHYGLRYHIYADDIQLYHIFDPSIPGEAAVAVFKLSMCANEIRIWMTRNKLKLNESKTEFFMAVSSHNMHRLVDTKITIGNADIEPSLEIKNLGITFDSKMTMSPHITALCRTLNFSLWNISRIRRFVDQETCINAMRALILSKLDYGNALLSGCKVTDIARLQRIQNRAARIVFQVPRRHPSSELLDSLHWLPVEKRIIFKILMHIYKSLNDLSPKYLVDCFKIHIPVRKGLRSALDETRLVVPRTNRLIGDRSFSARGSTLWNNIPPSIRVSTTLSSFKKNLDLF